MAPAPSHGSPGAFRLYLPVMDYLARRGIDVPAFLAQIGLPPDLTDDPDARVRRSEQEAIWRRAIEVTGDPLLPARVASEFPPSTLGVIIYLARSSRDGIEAVQRVRNFVALMQDEADLELAFEPGLAVIHMRTHDGYVTILPACEYGVALHAFIGRSVSAGSREPRELRIAHPAPPHAAAFEAFVRVPVRWGAASNAVAYPSDAFRRALPGADAGLSDLLEAYARELLSRVPAEHSFVDRVRACVARRLPNGSPGIEDVAAELRMSARSVRRRLAAEGATYRGTLDALRCELALRALESHQQGIDAIAQELGFSDASAFHKAFRRWTGRRPADFASRGSGA
jgi:AraC-like DNA-binding protein